MVIDLKYHLTTIIAIFLALGIGILIGSAMIGDDGMVREQQRLIVQIEQDLNTLRSQNGQFKTKLTTLESTIIEQDQFIDQLVEDAITGKLTGLRCLMISDPKKADTKSLISTLKIAGMEVTDFTSLPEKWQAVNVAATWDMCLLLTSTAPPGVELAFQKGQIFKSVAQNLTSKKGVYQLVQSLAKAKDKLLSTKMLVEPETREGNSGDISFDPGLQ